MRAIDTIALHAETCRAWELPGTGECWLINYSENRTFGITSDAGQYVLRVHRPGYQSLDNINSELAWLEALGRDTELRVPVPIAGLDGAYIQHLPFGSGTAACVLFRHIPGHEPQLDTGLVPHFRTLGRYAATLHRHAATWEKPASFQRHEWSAEQILDPDGLWGDWRRSPDVDNTIRPVLDRVDAQLRSDIAAYGKGPEQFGLIHADMRLGNLLIDGDDLALIDFDDSGFCWFAYDFAAAVSFHEDSALLPELREAWFEGYLPVRTLQPEDIAAMDCMLILRRMALLAWIGSHAETELAQKHRPGFAEGTAMLAENYLANRRPL
ncbi:aminoglycoside phosphotransferase [Devosia pacifica]|uniref:Aminoglycoside phosphotransferase n=1 Tax=Devosia pacifica TaxID=1335967 RepID=A0A918SG42_9HYPH|nr:phosphotransferase [Devosia pacifica]GHA36730.1 aminoglycoside phosphotransferase [Devosia pacifica]